jgi:acetyl-CoA carboxylase biotin carboxylase subunit
MFKRVLVANRGEIAVRILRSLREMEIESVAVYSEADADAPHVRMADRAVCLGPAPAAQSYLDAKRVLDAARDTSAEAIAPGYGFLSENAEFARAVADAGLTFIGPPASAIETMGSKTAAREAMTRAGVPVVPGGPAGSVEEALTSAERVGYPILLKARAGGGGKGMRRVNQESELAAAFERARSEAERAFGDGTVYIEKVIDHARHVEIQILGDQHDNLVHLYERDCSIQRRHQKVIEETPCPDCSEETILAMAKVSVDGARAVGYYSAGTFEFLLGEDEQFYFLEMNTRLQVEHPITEWVTGIDLVREMTRIAAGEPLGFTQSDVVRRGAAIECRLYAEDPKKGFLPSPGTITDWHLPEGPFVRNDSGVEAHSQVTPYYDPMIAKLSVFGRTREEARQRMSRALGECRIGGLRTNIEFHKNTMVHPDFREGHYDTGFIDLHREALTTSHEVGTERALEVAIVAAALEHESRSKRPAKNGPEAEATSGWVASHRSKILRK